MLKFANSYASQAAVALAGQPTNMWHSVRSENAEGVLKDHIIKPRVLGMPSAVEAVTGGATGILDRAGDRLTPASVDNQKARLEHLATRHKIAPSGSFSTEHVPEVAKSHSLSATSLTGSAPLKSVLDRAPNQRLLSLPEGYLPVEHTSFGQTIAKRRGLTLDSEAAETLGLKHSRESALYTHPDSVSLAVKNPLRRYGNIHGLIDQDKATGNWARPAIHLESYNQTSGKTLQKSHGAHLTEEVTGWPSLHGETGQLPTAPVKKYFYHPKALIDELGKEKGVAVARQLKSSGKAIPITRRVGAVMRRLGAAVL